MRTIVIITTLLLLAAQGIAFAREAAPAKKTSAKHHGYRASQAHAQKSCGTFMYRKNGHCNDARNK